MKGMVAPEWGTENQLVFLRVKIMINVGVDAKIAGKY
jgi:hypothetical protein